MKRKRFQGQTTSKYPTNKLNKQNSTNSVFNTASSSIYLIYIVNLMNTPTNVQTISKFFINKNTNYLDFNDKDKKCLNAICFNEDLINKLSEIVLSIFADIAPKFIQQSILNNQNFDHSSILNYLELNINNILIKYFLQVDERLIFVSKSFFDLNNFEKEKVRLFGGFNSNRHLFLQYTPIKSNEVTIIV